MRTILVIDDDPSFLKETQNILGGAGYRVLQASDGQLAARMFESMHGAIDLAIVDLNLPGVNGFELIGALSRRPNPIKIIATSGVYKNAQLESASALGAHAVLRKPAGHTGLPRQQWLGTVQELIGAP